MEGKGREGVDGVTAAPRMLEMSQSIKNKDKGDGRGLDASINHDYGGLTRSRWGQKGIKLMNLDNGRV